MILITGINGLIGKTLSSHLRNLSYTVQGLDSNLPLDHPDYGDINQLDALCRCVEHCQGIIHLAAVSRVVWGQQQPERCWQTNVIGTENILKAAYSSSHKPWFIYASSREVYGQQQRFPVIESASLLPMNIYAQSKVAAEELVKQYQSFGIKSAILRFSSVYGRVDDHADRVVPAFCRAAARGKPLQVEGLNNTFDFTHVTDVVEGITRAITQLRQGQNLPPIHLTTGKPTTLGELANLACAASIKPATLIEKTARDFDVAKFYGDPSLALEKLGWVPKVDINTGVGQLVNAFLEENE